MKFCTRHIKFFASVHFATGRATAKKQRVASMHNENNTVIEYRALSRPLVIYYDVTTLHDLGVLFRCGVMS